MKKIITTFILTSAYFSSQGQGQQLAYSTQKITNKIDSTVYIYSNNTDTIITQVKMGDGGGLEVDPMLQNSNGMYSNSNCETPPTNGNQLLEYRYFNGILTRGKIATYNLNKQITSYTIYDITASPSPSDSLFKNDYEYDVNGNKIKENYYEGYPFVLMDTKKYFYSNNLLDSTHYQQSGTNNFNMYTKFYYNGIVLSGLNNTINSISFVDTGYTTFFHNINNKIVKDSTQYSNNTFSIVEYIRNNDDQIIFIKNNQLLPNNDTLAEYTYNTFGNLVSSKRLYDNTRYYFYNDIVQPNSTNNLEHKFVCSLYPNPSQSIAVINYYSSDNKNYDFVLSDLIGNKIMTLSENGFVGEHNIKIYLENSSKGIYFVSVISNNQLVKTMKLVKE